MLVSIISDYFHYVVAINKYKMNLKMTPGRLTQNKCACVIETFEFGDFVNYLLIKILRNESEKKHLKLFVLTAKGEHLQASSCFLSC